MKTDFFDKVVKISLERFHSDFFRSFFFHLKRARATMIRVINYLTKKSCEMQEKNKIAPNHRQKKHGRFPSPQKTDWIISSFQKVSVAYRLRSFWKMRRLRRNSPKPTIVIKATTPPQTPGRTGPKMMSIAAEDSLLLEVEFITKKLRPSSAHLITTKKQF